MSGAGSSYYPPRARWYSPLLYFGSAVSRRLALDRIHLPSGVNWWELFFSFLIPGLGFYFRAPGLLGRAALGASALLLMVFFAELGRPVSNMAFGLLLAVHVSGLGSLFDPLMAGSRFRSRVFLSLALFTLLGLLLYRPALNYMDAHWFTPLRIRNQTVVVRKFASVPRLRRDELIAYSISEAGDHSAYIAEGFAVGPVLATSGDSIRFSENGFQINGVPRPSLPHMPKSGGFVVSGKNWFVWPDFDIGGHGGVAEKTVSDIALQAATISESQFLGKPFKWWFWHHQVAQ